MSLPLVAGLIASVLHVLSGPDHLAAITPLAIDTKDKAWKIGLFWGIGHLFGMLFIGLLFYLFRNFIPHEAISTYSEKLVAVVLIGVGTWTLYRLLNRNRSTHSHAEAELDSILKSKKPLKTKEAYSLGIGVIHGLAGISHFLIFLPALGFKNNLESAQYILGFGLGTVLAMSLFSLLLGSTRNILGQKSFKAISRLKFVGGVFALAVGLYWFYLAI